MHGKQNNDLFAGCYFHYMGLAMSNESIMANQKKTSHWGERLRATLKEREMSIRKAARVAEVSPSVLDSWTSGASPKDLHAVKRLADELGVSFSWLLLGERENRQLPITVSELFDEQPFFDGYARIRLDRLIPKGGK